MAFLYSPTKRAGRSFNGKALVAWTRKMFFLTDETGNWRFLNKFGCFKGMLRNLYCKIDVLAGEFWPQSVRM